MTGTENGVQYSGEGALSVQDVTHSHNVNVSD